MPYNIDTAVIFIHIPKTAGTSINSILGLNKLYSPVEIPEPQHLTGKEVKEKVIPALWDNAFKFTIIREPIDKVLSDFAWRLERTDPSIIPQFDNSEEGFNQYLWFAYGVIKGNSYKTYTYSHFRPQYQFIEDVELDKIFKFDNLKELEEHFKLYLPHQNKREIKLNDVLSKRNEKLIREIYAKDFDL